MGIFRRKSEERTNPALPGGPDQWWNYHPGAERIAPNTGLQVADIYACVRCLSDAASSVPLIAYRRSGRGRQRLESGRLPELLQRPAPATTGANLIGLTMAHLAGWGNAFLGKFRDRDDKLTQLALLLPERVQVELVNGEPRYTVTDPQTGRQTRHGTDDIVHIRGFSVDGLTGLSPIAQCRLAVSYARGLGEFSEAFVHNGGRPSGILKLPSSNPSQMAWTKEMVEERHGGSRNAHRVAIVSGDVDWVPMTGPLDDLQFAEQRKLSTAEIARIFRVPVWMIGGSTGDSLTYSNTEQQGLQFVTFSLRPWLVLIEQAISADPDLCSQNQYVEFLLDGLLRADSATRSEVYTKALDPITGWMTRDEVRRLENLEPESPQPQLQPEPQSQFNGGVLA